MQVVPVQLKPGISLISAFSCFLVQLVSSVTYGPSLVSLTRWDRLSRGPTIFNPDTGRVIQLEDYPSYSVVIPLAPDSPTATSNQVFISRRVSGPGEFTVEAPSGYGVMAVIQSLDLRVAEDTCNDFILFSEVDAGGVETTGTCGKVDIRDASASPQGLIGPRTFISDSGRMKILFYHGFIWGLVRNFNFDIFDSSLNPDLKVEIVFTAYKECPSVNSTISDPAQGEDVPNLATCSPSLPNTKTCIHKELFCDKSVNCAFSQDFGSDEDTLTCKPQNIELLESRNLPTTSTFPTTTTTTKASTTQPTTTSTASSEASSSSEPQTYSPPPQPPNSISSSTTTEKLLDKLKQKGSSSGSVGLTGLVRRFPPIDIKLHHHRASKVIARGSFNVSASANHTNPRLVLNKFKSVSKMPVEKNELFVDIDTAPVEDALVNGLSKEDILSEEENEVMTATILTGVLSVTGVVLLLIGLVRMYHCYHKVIWNPHGSRLKSSESPPETLNANLMRKMKALAMESEEVFNEKKGKGLKEQPPSYEILFPLPDEKDPHLKV